MRRGTPPKPEDVALARRHELRHETPQDDDKKTGGAVFYTTTLAGVMIILTCSLVYFVGLR
jgi:hypothetical protein